MNTKYWKILKEYLKGNDNKGTLIGYQRLLKRNKAPYTSRTYIYNLLMEYQEMQRILYHRGEIILTEYKNALKRSAEYNQAVLKAQKERSDRRIENWNKRRKIKSQS